MELLKEKKGKGISPFIASVLTILFGVMMLAIVLSVVNPTFKRAQDSSVISDGFQNMNLLNSAIKEVASESQGSKRTVAVSVSDGEYSTNVTTNSLIFKYEPSEDMQLTGTRGDIEILRGSVFLDFFNWYVEGGKADPVWKNTTGLWTATDYKYRGSGGLAYHNLSTIENYKFEGSIYNSSGATGGQVFVLPANPERLVAFWAFDNRTGGKAYDWSGNMNNGTLIDMNTSGNSTSGWQDSSICKAGLSCLKFDGVNDFVNCTNSSKVRIVSQLTVSLWARTSTAGSTVIIDKDQEYTLNFTSGDLNFKIGTTEPTNARYTLWSDGTWYHVLGTWNGSHASLYVNGAMVGTDASSVSSTVNDLLIGTDSQSPGSYFNGMMDEIKLWNVSLTSDEVSAEYELSAKKLIASGSKSVNARTPNAAIVLSNPDGVTSFDEIKVSRENKEQAMIISYSKIDLNGTLRIVKGDYKVQIEHMGTNTTLSEPIIQITS